LKSLFFSTLSALLLILSFPPHDLGFLAWIAFLPFFSALDGKPIDKVLQLSCLTGFLFFLGLIHWIHHVTWFGMILLCVYLSIYFVGFGLGVRYFSRRWAPYFVPALWVSLEFLRSTLFTGFGWGFLGYSQWRFIPLIQIADLTGVYGVSFLIVFENALFYELWRRKEARGRLFLFVILLNVMLGASLWYGGQKKSEFLNSSKIFRASVVQGNIPQDIKWDIGRQDEILKKYIRMSEAASKDNPDAIFWPETAFPGFLPDEKTLFHRLATFNQNSKTYLLFGVPWNTKGEAYNSAVWMKEGMILQRYDKLHLVPYGEFIPFEGLFPFLRQWI